MTGSQRNYCGLWHDRPGGCTGIARLSGRRIAWAVGTDCCRQALEHIARKHPADRDVCIAALTRQLEQFSGHDPVFSANLVVSLVELEAVEAAPLIERAFAADAVELTVMGDWEDVQVELGLKEERESPRPRFGWVEDVGDVGDEPSDMEEQERYLARQQQKQSEQNRKRKAKTKRKQRRASRKKNR